MPKKWPKSLQLSTSEMLQVVCMTLHPFHTQRGKIPILHLSIWSLPQDRRFPAPPPMPAGQIRSACCVLWKTLGFIQWLLFGGIYSVSPSISSSDEATFSAPFALSIFISLSCSFITLSEMLPVSQIPGVWFSLPSVWFHLSGIFCLKEKHKTHVGRCSPPSLLLFSFSHYSLYFLQSLIILWFYHSVSHSTPCFPLMCLSNKLRLNFNSFFRFFLFIL